MPEIDIYILIAQIINFWVLLAIFHFAIGKKLNASIKKRRSDLEKLAKAEEHYDQKMSLAAQQKQEMIDAARQTTATLMKESEIISNEKAAKIMQQAHRDALAVLDGWKREIEKQRLTMLTQMKEHIIDVSLRLNEKMFGPGKTNKEFLEAELAKMK